MAKRLSTGSGTGPNRSSIGRPELAQLVLGLGEREAPVQVDLLRLGGMYVGRDVRVHLRVDAHRARRGRRVPASSATASPRSST